MVPGDYAKLVGHRVRRVGYCCLSLADAHGT